MTAGYSGTPLAKKLNLKDGMRVWFADMPESVRAEIDEAGFNLSVEDVPGNGLNAAHIFVTECARMEEHLDNLRRLIDPAGFVWVSWPKKASRVETDITEDTIRKIALPRDWVDIKVCAIDEIWSGLKLVIRKELRG